MCHACSCRIAVTIVIINDTSKLVSLHVDLCVLCKPVTGDACLFLSLLRLTVEGPVVRAGTLHIQLGALNVMIWR